MTNTKFEVGDFAIVNYAARAPRNVVVVGNSAIEGKKVCRDINSGEVCLCQESTLKKVKCFEG